jgi:uncharacterized protein
VPHVSLVTLGTEDLDRAARFYEGWGWRRSPASQDEIVFLEGGAVVLALFSTEALAHEAGLPNSELPPYRGIALAMNLPSREEVDQAVAAAAALGASVVAAPSAADWGGYSGYLTDPDGHLWEVAHNPFFPLDDDGRIHPTG